MSPEPEQNIRVFIKKGALRVKDMFGSLKFKKLTEEVMGADEK